ncbi:MAG: amine oxidase [Halochromatium sp.]|nr:amine oxidase [Halochromatium sp.]
MSLPAYSVLVLGAGPTGLGAMLRLLELGETDCLLIEAEEQAGGLAASVVDDQGFTWDLGGHVQFSHYQAFDRYMEQALGRDGWIDHQRESWVWMRDCFVPYPFQNNLHRLPGPEKWACVQGLIEANERTTERPTDFEHWIRQTFGQGIADSFLLPYNLKVWAYPPAMLNAHWVGERVAVPDLRSVLKSICLNEDQPSWGPNNRFRFPLHGGTGAIWENLAASIPAQHRHFGDGIVALDADRRQVITAGGACFSYKRLINTIPLDRLCRLIGDSNLIEQSSQLKYSSVHVVGIGLRGQPPEALRTKCWMYFPENDCPFYRVTVFSNYSPNNVPEPGATWSLMAEVSESPCRTVDEQTVVDDVVRGMRATRLIGDEAPIISRWHRRLHHGYPTPSVERDTILQHVLPALEERDIYSRGRFGAWKYEVSNQDHSMMQGVELAERLVNGHKELTLLQPDLINRSYNAWPYPEWAQTDMNRKD